MRLLFDADGLIKLQRAGLLQQVFQAFESLVPEAVYAEAVTEGKQRHYEDAGRIEEAIATGARTVQVAPLAAPVSGLGEGETAVLALASEVTDAIVVSDDRRFLAILALEGVPYLTPGDVLVVLRRQRTLGHSEAMGAIERLRPLIRAAAYWEARQALDDDGGDQ